MGPGALRLAGGNRVGFRCRDHQPGNRAVNIGIVSIIPAHADVLTVNNLQRMLGENWRRTRSDE